MRLLGIVLIAAASSVFITSMPALEAQQEQDTAAPPASFFNRAEQEHGIIIPPDGLLDNSRAVH